MKILGLSRKKVKEVIENGKVTIAVYGLGRIGLPLAAIFSYHGAHVIGVDIKDDTVDKINKGINPYEDEPGLSGLIEKGFRTKRLEATTNGIEAAKRSDVMIIVVPVVADKDGNIKMDPLLDVAKKITEGLERGDIIITETTLPPGTTESLASIFDKSEIKLGEYGLAHAPERTMVGRIIRDITSEYPKIVGADSPKTLEAVVGLYETINKKGVIAVSNIKTAEAVKVFEGVYRDVNIALANQLALWAEEQELDVYEIINAANTQPYSHIHKPGAGVGGHCIPVYPWFLINTAKRTKLELIRLAREINNNMPHRVVELVVKALNHRGRSVKGSNILVLGLAFRGNTKGHYLSPALDIAKELKDNWEANVFVYDPYYDPSDVEELNLKWKNDYKDIDAIVIVTDHKEFQELDLERISEDVRTKIIVDARNMIKPEKALKLGFDYWLLGNSPKLYYSINQ